MKNLIWTAVLAVLLFAPIASAQVAVNTSDPALKLAWGYDPAALANVQGFKPAGQAASNRVSFTVFVPPPGGPEESADCHQADWRRAVRRMARKTPATLKSLGWPKRISWRKPKA